MWQSVTLAPCGMDTQCSRGAARQPDVTAAEGCACTEQHALQTRMATSAGDPIQDIQTQQPQHGEDDVGACLLQACPVA